MQHVQKLAYFVLFLTLITLGGTSCDPQAAGWITLDGLLQARNQISYGLEATCRVEHASCVKKYGVKTPAFETCIKSCKDALTGWTTYARPAFNSGAFAAKAGLEIARSAKSKDFNWALEMVPLACALWSAVKQWGHLLPSKGQTILTLIEPYAKGACP